jgi:hypothetical protein
VVLTNNGEEMDCYLFDNPVDNPTATDVHEKACRDAIQDFINHCRDMDNKGISPYTRYSLYVTGLTPLLTSFLKSWVERQEQLEMGFGDLILWHWDTKTEQYVPQKWAMIT